jgi:hypothetical protein
MTGLVALACLLTVIPSYCLQSVLGLLARRAMAPEEGS